MQCSLVILGVFNTNCDHCMRTNEPQWYLFLMLLVCHSSPSPGPLGKKYQYGRHEPTSYRHFLRPGSDSPLLPPCPVFLPCQRKSFCCGRSFVSLACMLGEDQRKENSKEVIKSNIELMCFAMLSYHWLKNIIGSKIGLTYVQLD